MGTDNVITAIEKYLRDFIAYLVAFFWPEADKKVDDADPYGINRSVIFAILSAILGAYLWNRYIVAGTESSADLTGTLVDSLMRWLSFGLLLYGIMRGLQIEPSVVATVVAVTRVFAVAHVMAVYLAYVTMKVLWFFSSTTCYTQLSAGRSATLAFFFELLLVWTYLRREVKSLCPPGTAQWRQNTAYAVFLPLVSLIVLTPLAIYKIATANQPGTCLCGYNPALQGCAK